MKKYIYLVMAVLSLGFASCSQELLPEEQLPVNVEKKLVTLTVQAGSPTRLGIQEDENAVHFTWEEGDVLHVVSGTDSYTDFTLTEGAGTNRGIFTAEASFTEGQKLQIIYSKNPDHPFQLDENGNVQIDLSGQTGELDERYQYMYGTATYSTEGALTTTLQHLVYTIKLNLSLPSDFTGNIQQFRFLDKSCNYRSNATLVLNPTKDEASHNISAGDLIYRSYYESEGNIHNPDCENDIILNNLTVDGNSQATVYLYLMATTYAAPNNDNSIAWTDNRPENRPCFTLVDESGCQFASLPIKRKTMVENGNMYTITANCSKYIYFDNEDQADGSEESPYEIATTDQFYSLMLRINNQLYDKRGSDLRYCHYVLTTSIELDDRYPWGPIELRYGAFDGQGHIIRGNQTIVDFLESSAFFGYIENSTIKNLTLDANISFNKSTDLQFAGGFIAHADNSVIENCHNLSNLTAMASYIGGIVGSAAQTSIVACSNRGNLSFEPANSNGVYCTTIGGIVGSASYGSIIKGCYTNSGFGLLPYYGDEYYLGGLVGVIPSWDSEVNQIIGCWTLPRLQEIYPSSYYIGGFLGRSEDPDLVNITTSYFYECFSPVGLGGWSGSVDSFSGKTPTAEQIASMNAAISDTGYQYNEYGTITKVSGN